MPENDADLYSRCTDLFCVIERGHEYEEQDKLTGPR